MPTPEAWRENLERISKIGAGTDPAPEKVDKEQAIKAVENLKEGCDQLASTLLKILEVAPEDAKHPATSGFIMGVVTAVLQIIADADRK